MAPTNDQRYDALPPIPSYDEAIAGGPPSSSPYDDPANTAFESQGLLGHRSNGSTHAPPRRPGGYRPPTVETDDEYTDSEAGDEEEDHVRMEMQELEIDDPASTRPSIWAKRMPFSLSLPKWKWSWRWRLPRLPAIRLGERSDDEESGPSIWNRMRCGAPSLHSTATFLMVVRVLAIVLVMGFLYLLFMSDIFSNMARRLGGGQMFDPESVRIHVQGSIDRQRIRDSLQHYAAYAHLAGSEGDYALAMDTKNLFAHAGLEDVTVDEYYVYLNYPRPDGRAVQILGADGKPTWSAQLDEGDDDSQTAGHQTLAFHGHSFAGDVTGPLLYANYGSRDDFQALTDSGIDTTGAIALVRHFGPVADVALKVKAAELAGFAGCLVYTDPSDDGFVRGPVAPAGHYMPADGVQRGSVSLRRWVLGDPLTPGWESKKGQPRMKTAQTTGLVHIPSLPLAWRDAQVLLQHLQGAGQSVPAHWVGGVPDVGDTWYTGNASGPTVRLRNQQDEPPAQPVWNVYGRIAGVEQPEKSIIIGAHRDAWAYGASDAGSGSALLLELVRVFGDLVDRGWRPLRTIEFMSWDAAEYNLIGSTEFVENTLEGLRKDGYAYLNIDAPVRGDDLHARGSPVFQKILYRILDRVYDPARNTTLRALWDARGGEIEGLDGVDSDYVAFQDLAGVSSLDLAFEATPDVFPYAPAHSGYDTFAWMDETGDPGWAYHGMLAEVLGLLLLELADRPILPFDMAAYANALYAWGNELAGDVAGAVTRDGEDKEAGKEKEGDSGGLVEGLQEAVREVIDAVGAFQDWEHVWQNSVLSANGWEPTRLGSKRCAFNDVMAGFETALLDVEQGGGIPNRTQFRHVVFGPQLWPQPDTSKRKMMFPAIRDVLATSGNVTLAREVAGKTAGIVRAAAAPLREWED